MPTLRYPEVMSERTYHHGNLRSALLERAWDAVDADGPAALSLRQLARDAGVSHGASARHFRDKQALLDAVALRGFERLNAALADVLATDTAVSNELTTLIGQISNDVQFTLDSAGANVTELINSLDALTTQVEALQPPVADAAAALTVDRETLDSILVDAKNTAALVHSARVSAQESADDLSGK